MKYPATIAMTIPSGIEYCCARHAQKLGNLMVFMGWDCKADLLQEEAECKNCINEEVK